jgi:hypothetical protein
MSARGNIGRLLFVVGYCALAVGPVVACTASQLDAFSRAAAPISSAVVAVAPVMDHALGAYADAAREAQRRADLAPASPDALLLRAALARLAEADARVAAAQRPVACVEPVGAVAPAPAVDVDALAAAIDARIAATLDAREALVKTRRKRARDAGAESGERRMMTISRAHLEHAEWPNVLRLARSLRLRTPPDGCSCVGHRRGLIERVARACS